MMLRQRRILFLAVLLDLFLLGNGYLIQINNTRLRVFLFLLCVACTIVDFASGRIKFRKELFLLSFLYAAGLITGIIVGLSNGNNIGFIFADLKPLLFFGIIFFIVSEIRTRDDIEFALRVMLVCVTIQILAFLSLMCLLKLGLIDYTSVFTFLKQSDEFIFRHNPELIVFNGFLYKGFFHIGIALIFFVAAKNIGGLFLGLLAINALVLTETRGLMLAAFSSLVMAILLKSSVFLRIIIVFCGSMVSFFLVRVYNILDVFSRSQSDNVRLQDIEWLFSNFEFKKLFLGEGFGAIINGRSKIELNYLELLYKQGAVGLLPWIMIFFLAFGSYRQAQQKDKELALALFLSVTYCYVAGATNTFLTGSIGMGVVMLAIAMLFVLQEQVREET